MRKLSILGTRGIPAKHGGFETFAEKLSVFLAERGWDVTVYCQVEGSGQIHEDKWQGVRRIHIPVNMRGAKSTIIFDFLSTIHAAKQRGLILSLGYATAVFNIVFRARRIPNVINMDGLEWKRPKWKPLAKAWLYLNERIACILGNHLIADHPEIKTHLMTRVRSQKISVIPYGSDKVEAASVDILARYSLEPHRYIILIARPEPENSIHEIISAFSRKERGLKLVVLGNYQPSLYPYHKQVLDAASDEVLFVGGVYDQGIVQALRFHSLFYVHGHTVGGTNPSLVEAMGAGNPVLAHDNSFNRWVAGDKAYYFDYNNIESQLEAFISDQKALHSSRKSSLNRHESEFSWDKVLRQYEELLTSWHPNIKTLTRTIPATSPPDLLPLKATSVNEKHVN